MKKNYYAIIPANVRYDDELPPNAKLLFGEITALCNEKGYCWASNSYFSELYKVKKETISRWVKALSDRGYIAIRYKYAKDSKAIDERHIYINHAPIDKKINTPLQNNQGGVDKKINTPIDKKVKENNTVINTTFNNTTEQQLLNKDSKYIIEFWDNNGFGYNNINAKQKLLLWLDDSKFKNPVEMILKALEIASDNNKRTLAYVEGILKNWTNQSILTVEEIDSSNKKSDKSKSNFGYDPTVDTF